MSAKRLPYRGDDFCLIHGYDHMVSELGNPIPLCAACEDERREAIKKMVDEAQKLDLP